MRLAGGSSSSGGVPGGCKKLGSGFPGFSSHLKGIEAKSLTGVDGIGVGSSAIFSGFQSFFGIPGLSSQRNGTEESYRKKTRAREKENEKMDSEKALNVNNGPSLCSNGCGFFGSPSTKNLCSKCYNDFLKQEIIGKSTKLAVSSVNKVVSPKTTVGEISHNTIESATSAGVAALSIKDDGKKANKNRCERCNKKVGLLGFECRCGGVFCGVHRYAEKHSCTFDYKVLGRDVLAKANPRCVADKQEDRI